MVNIYTKIYLFPTEEGGRKRGIISNYRPNICFEKGKITDAICSFEGEPIAPGETRNIILSFFPDSVQDIRLLRDTLFTIQEGGKKIGHGVIIRKRNALSLNKKKISIS